MLSVGCNFHARYHHTAWRAGGRALTLGWPTVCGFVLASCGSHLFFIPAFGFSCDGTFFPPLASMVSESPYHGEMTMSNHEQRLRLADLIDAVVDGKTSPEAAIQVMEKWVDIPWKERQIDLAWHTLKHFEIDWETGRIRILEKPCSSLLSRWSSHT
jgi:hypothetical protein